MAPKTPPKPAGKKKPASSRPRRTNNDLYGLLLDVKADLLTVKEDVVGVKGSLLTLTQHVNHEIEALNDAWTKKIDGKLDDDQLLTSLGFKMLNNRWVRWAFGGVLTSTLALLAYAHWAGPAGAWAEFVLRVIFGRGLP